MHAPRESGALPFVWAVMSRRSNRVPFGFELPEAGHQYDPRRQVAMGNKSSWCQRYSTGGATLINLGTEDKDTKFDD